MRKARNLYNSGMDLSTHLPGEISPLRKKSLRAR
jgi:hypothetical protein